MIVFKNLFCIAIKQETIFQVWGKKKKKKHYIQNCFALFKQNSNKHTDTLLSPQRRLSTIPLIVNRKKIVR